MRLALVTAVDVQADNTTIPWMTGLFDGSTTFSMQPTFSPDGKWLFATEVMTVEEQDIWSPFECGKGICERSGVGVITGGTADGIIYQVNGTDFTLAAALSGHVTGGDVQLSVSLRFQRCLDE
jgi:hypothetical protein